MRAAIYLRVSTLSQTGADHVSLAVQEAACRDFIQRRGGEVALVLRDEGRSGLDSDRPAYQRLFGLASAKEIDAAVVYRLDRLGRDAAEFLMASRRLRAFGCQVFSATEPAESNLVAGILALLAEDESVRIRARTLPAMIARLQEGKWIGPAPRGYDIVPHPTGGKTLQPNDDAWKITRLFELYAAGSYSLAKLQPETALLGLTSRELGMTRATIMNILTSPAYAGRVVWGRTAKLHTEDGRHSKRRDRSGWQEFPGQHTALVSEELFDRVQAVMARNRREQSPAPHGRQLLVGRIYCACGARMAAKPSQYGKTDGKKDGRVWYCYFCLRKAERTAACRQPNVSVRIIDAQVKAQVMATLTITPETRELTRELIAANEDAFFDGQAQRKRQLQRAHRRLANERQTLARQLAGGIVQPSIYQETDAGYASQLAAIDAELTDLVTVEMPDIGKLLDLVEQIDWQDLEPEDWREVLAGFVERVIVTDRSVEITWLEGTEALRRILQAVK